MPAPARTAVLPLPKGSKAKPMRGEKCALGVCAMPRGMPASPGKRTPRGALGTIVDLTPRDKCSGKILALDGRLLEVISQTQVGCESWRDLVIVLNKACVIPGVQQSVVWSVLFHGRDLSGDEVSQSIPGGRCGRGKKAEGAKVGQIPDNCIYFGRNFGAEVEGVFSFDQADDVTKTIEVSGAYRPCQGPSGVEVARDGELGKRFRSLDGEA